MKSQLSIAVVLLLAAFPASADAGAATAVPAQRQTEIRDLLRQDCGSCHGVLLTGGLGPSLKPESLQRLDVGTVTATILHGRPGTPMPPWQPFLSEAEARWLAEQLLAGTTEESKP